MDPRVFVSLCLLTLTPLPVCLSEMYTSLLNVKLAISVERKLIDSLKTYIEQETERLRDIRRFYAKVSNLHSGVYKGQTTALANPLLAFTLIKRLHSEWPNVVYSDEALENSQGQLTFSHSQTAHMVVITNPPGSHHRYPPQLQPPTSPFGLLCQALRSSYEREGSALPKLEDLQGAAKGLMRLQDVYGLQVADLVRGHFRRVTNGETSDIYKPVVSVPLSGDDCFLVGKVAYDLEDYYHSVPWLEQSVHLFRGVRQQWSLENEATLEDALDHLAFSYFKTGNVSYALSLSQELLHHDPVNERVLQNVEKYEKLLVVRPQMKSNGLRRPASTHLRTRDTYERLCQNHGSHPRHFQNHQLSCNYFTSGSPGLFLRPAKREVLSLQPFVVLYHDFITDTEAEDIKVLAQPGLRRSVVASGEKQATADYRISKTAWLKDSSYDVIGKLNQRISMVTGLNVNYPYAEYLQVVNYGIGGHYEPHFDHATSPNSPVFKLKTGNRVATFMIYLSSVEAGGSTAFIYANFSVPVAERAAIFWWNLHRNGLGDGDTLHAGCPVLVGDKWVANKWIHEYGQEFNHHCTMNPDE